MPQLKSDRLLGRDTAGNAITNGVAVSGQVIVFAEEPVLVANRNNTLTLYGRPGGSYAVESRRQFAAGDAWGFLRRFPLTNRFWTFPVSAPPPTSFYRAYEFKAEPPIMEVGAVGSGGNLPLLIFGQPGVNYTLERAVSVSGQIAWVDVLSFTMVNSWQFIEVPGGSGTLFFRVRQNPTVPVRLDILAVNGPLVTLRLHGKPGTNYVIEAKTQLGASAAWVPVLSLALTNASQTFTWTNAGPPTRFFRAVEGGSVTQPFVVMETARGSTATLRLDGLSGGLYLIEAASSLNAPISWVPVQSVILTNASQRLIVPNHGEPVRIFRARIN